MKSESFKGHLAAICLNLIFGLNISISKALLSASWMSPMGFTIARMLCGCVVFWTISLFTPREKTTGRDLFTILMGGFLGLAVTQVAFSVGIQFVSPVLWSLIAALSPIIVLLLSAIFLKDPISGKKAIGVIIGISGAVLVVLKNRSGGVSSGSVWGICIALVCITCYSAYIVIVRKTSEKYTPITTMKWMYLLAFVVLSPFSLPELPGQRIFSSEAALLPVLQLGFSLFLSSVVGYCLMPVALKRIKATTASMYNGLQPLTASAAAIIIGQDFFTWDKPLALILIITGVYIVTHSHSGDLKPEVV